MSDFNFSVIEGHLKADPAFKDGKCRMLVLSNRAYTNKAGNKITEVTTFDIITTGRLAETCNKYLKKNSRVLVSGRLSKADNYVYIVGKEVNFLSPDKKS